MIVREQNTANCSRRDRVLEALAALRLGSPCRSLPRRELSWRFRGIWECRVCWHSRRRVRRRFRCFSCCGATQSASAQEAVKGTACEAPADENTRSACVVAILNCAFVTGYGRTAEEKDRIYRGCIRKLVARYKQETD